MSQDAADSYVPDIVLERYRLNELPADEYNRVADRLRRDAALRLRIESLDRSDQEIRRDFQPEFFLHRLQKRSALRPVRRPLLSWALPTLLAAATLILVVSLPPPGDGDGTRIKGLLPALTVYRKTDSGSETLSDGAIVHRGDVIRLAYRAAGKPYGVIVSIDGRGAVTLHLPPHGEHSASLHTEPTVLLDQAYELDDAPRWERFYFVTGDASFPVHSVMDAARRAAGSHRPQPVLDLPPGLEQAIFLLQKEEPR